MGQKLVSIRFRGGSSPNLWSPEYSPSFKITVTGPGLGEIRITDYCPELVNSRELPLDPVNVQPLTQSVVRGMIKNGQNMMFLVDDAVVRWQIQFKDQFLTEGAWKGLASGSFQQN